MPTITGIPEFLQKNRFKNPKGAIDGPFNYAEDFPNTVRAWFSQGQKKFDICNTFIEADRGSRPS